MKVLISTFFFSLWILCANAQNYSLLNSVMAWAEPDVAKPALTLKWVNDTSATSYLIYRKTRDAKLWPSKVLATLGKTDLSWRDTAIQIGQAYEYRIKKTSGGIISYTYLYGGVNVEQVELKKTILLLVDANVKSAIQTEVNTLVEDLKNESWNVIELSIPKDKTAIEVKDTIRKVYEINPNLSSIFIIGHVAVPYSGNTNWDGHPDHQGAWVCDNYYADINGNWTDEFVSNVSAGRVENRNEIGDEKWDNDVIPSDVDFEVGRVDFFNMPALIKSETQLLKNYLNKDHLFRIGKIRPERRAIVQDNFNFAGEFFGSSGYRNYTVFFGPDSVKTDVFRDRLLEKSYLCAYGAGGGWYQGAGGISTTPQMATDSLRTVFTFLFGSYFGDWDVQDNFLRSALASGTILTCAWAGRPGWQIHHMAMGETIGFCGKTTINNQQYTGSPYGNRGAHVSLMGDPSLTLLPVLPPTGLTVTELGKMVNLSWKASTEASEGYSIFRRKLPATKFEMIADKIKATTYSESCLDKGASYEYLVAAIKLEKNASGTFNNRSAGTRAGITIQNSSLTEADILYIQDYEFLRAVANSVNSKKNSWLVNGKTIINDSLIVSLPCDPKVQKISLVSEGDCNVDTLSTLLNVICSVPEITKYHINPEIFCFGDVTSVYLDSISGAGPFTYLWSDGSTTNPITNAKGKLSVEVTSSKNTKASFDISLAEFDAIQITNIQVKNVNSGFNKGKVTGIQAQGGVPPYSYKVLNVSRQDSLEVGTYTLQVTDANGCVTTKTFEIKLNVATKDFNRETVNVFPNPAKEELFINTTLQLNQISLISVDGKDLGVLKAELISTGNYRINIHQLQAGYYQLDLGLQNQHQRISFVKE
ncbi:MAG: T9SS type A sorting domain-containing protein [Saprospiraceae bacterium]